jgi:SpoVK/Ycf46/Vps4 family AAA+-type ATPase
MTAAEFVARLSGVVRRRLPQPLKPEADQRGKGPDMSEKIEEPKAPEHDKGCGNPLCELCYPFAGQLAQDMRRPFPSDARIVWQAARDEYFESRRRPSLMDVEFIWSDNEPDATASAPRDQDDKNLEEARGPIKQYLLTQKHDVAFDDIVGNDAARAALLEAIEAPVKHKETYERYGMTPPKGVMLYGPPGCGKTMFAKAASAMLAKLHGAEVEMISIAGPSIQSPYVGVTERTIREIFAYARAYRKAKGRQVVVFIDEAEVLFPDRSGARRRVANWEESQVAQFLAEIDGMEANGAFVILATNRPEAIDEALLRDGRIGRKIRIERPSPDAFAAILTKAFAGAPTQEPVADLVTLAVGRFYSTDYRLADLINAETGEHHRVYLSNIVNGAMVASIASRSRSLAFARDISGGGATGIARDDVAAAVAQIFEENRRLPHEYVKRELAEILTDRALEAERS